MPTARYVHPEFGFFCPTPRFRRLFLFAVVGMACAALGLAVWATRDTGSALVAHFDGNASDQVAREAATLPIATAEAAPVRVEAPAATAAVRTSCGDDAGASTDGKCAAGKARKMRMVRVPTDRSAIASIPLGRTLAPSASALEGAPATSVAGQGDAAPSRSAQAAAADAAPAAAPQRKKSQRTAQSRRRDHSDGSPWREVRVDDWGARGYGSNDRGYQRGGYGRQGFFW
jgi:hypothetical protein